MGASNSKSSKTSTTTMQKSQVMPKEKQQKNIGELTKGKMRRSLRRAMEKSVMKSRRNPNMGELQSGIPRRRASSRRTNVRMEVATNNTAPRAIALLVMALEEEFKALLRLYRERNCWIVGVLEVPIGDEVTNATATASGTAFRRPQLLGKHKQRQTALRNDISRISDADTCDNDDSEAKAELYDAAVTCNVICHEIGRLLQACAPYQRMPPLLVHSFGSEGQALMTTLETLLEPYRPRTSSVSSPLLCLSPSVDQSEDDDIDEADASPLPNCEASKSSRALHVPPPQRTNSTNAADDFDTDATSIGTSIYSDEGLHCSNLNSTFSSKTTCHVTRRHVHECLSSRSNGDEPLLTTTCQHVDPYQNYGGDRTHRYIMMLVSSRYHDSVASANVVCDRIPPWQNNDCRVSPSLPPLPPRPARFMGVVRRAVVLSTPTTIRRHLLQKGTTNAELPSASSSSHGGNDVLFPTWELEYGHFIDSYFLDDTVYNTTAINNEDNNQDQAEALSTSSKTEPVDNVYDQQPTSDNNEESNILPDTSSNPMQTFWRRMVEMYHGEDDAVCNGWLLSRR